MPGRVILITSAGFGAAILVALLFLLRDTLLFQLTLQTLDFLLLLPDLYVMAGVIPLEHALVHDKRVIALAGREFVRDTAGNAS
jgi:uncharacterized membrane protein YkgB